MLAPYKALFKKTDFGIKKWLLQKTKPKRHRDLGFSDEAFLELVDFFREPIRLPLFPFNKKKQVPQRTKI